MNVNDIKRACDNATDTEYMVLLVALTIMLCGAVIGIIVLVDVLAQLWSAAPFVVVTVIVATALASAARIILRRKDGPRA